MLMVQNYYNPIQKFKIILFSAGIDTFIIHSFIIKNTFPFTSVPVRVGVILLVKQTETSIVKRHDRKPQREFSRLDARPQPGEPAASEASEQKNRNRFRTGKVRTRWWRWCLIDRWLIDYWWEWRWSLLSNHSCSHRLSSDHWSITRDRTWNLSVLLSR